jgi:hypothetical protein
LVSLVVRLIVTIRAILSSLNNYLRPSRSDTDLAWA